MIRVFFLSFILRLERCSALTQYRASTSATEKGKRLCRCSGEVVTEERRGASSGVRGGNGSLYLEAGRLKEITDLRQVTKLAVVVCSRYQVDHALTWLQNRSDPAV